MFSDVKVAASGGRTVVTVRENNLINRVVFEGNKKIEKATLEGQVEAKARGAFSEAVINADLARIHEVYRRSGRGTAKVTYRTVDLPNGRVDVIYQIDEGDKTGIISINFVGNNAYSERTLKGLMSLVRDELPVVHQDLRRLRSRSHRHRPRPGPPLLPEERLRRFPRRQRRRALRRGPDANGWVITVTVERGRAVHGRRRGGGFAPARPRHRQPSTASFAASVGDVYNAERRREDAHRRHQRGRRAPAIPSPRSARPASATRATHQVSLGFVVEDGPRVYVERINIRGNTRTRDYVIRRELDIAEGDAYNRVLTDRAERRLNGLGFFKKVRFSNEPGSAPDRVVINIDVEDQPTGSFSVAGGYSTQDGIIGEVSVSESNFLGRGQYVRLAGTGGQYSRGVDFSFTEPYFLGYRLAAGFDAFYKYSDLTRYSRYETTVVRRPAAPRPADHRGVRRHAALLALQHRAEGPEHAQAALQRLLDADPGLHGAYRRHDARTAGTSAAWRLPELRL